MGWNDNHKFTIFNFVWFDFECWHHLEVVLMVMVVVRMMVISNLPGGKDEKHPSRCQGGTIDTFTDVLLMKMMRRILLLRMMMLPGKTPVPRPIFHVNCKLMVCSIVLAREIIVFTPHTFFGDRLRHIFELIQHSKSKWGMKGETCHFVSAQMRMFPSQNSRSKSPKPTLKQLWC